MTGAQPVGIQLHEHVEALPVAEAPVPRIDRRVAAYLATLGRYGVVWLPAYALLSSRAPSLRDAVLLATGMACVWFLTLHKSFDAARLTLLSLGPALAAAIGTATGLVALSAVSAWAPLELTTRELAEVAGAVFVF